MKGTFWTILTLLVSLLGPASAKAATHRVSNDAPTLLEISILLYGTPSLWKDIATANSLRPPYRITPGMKLKLPKKPTLNRQDGRLALLNHWRRHFDLAESRQAPPALTQRPEAPPAVAEALKKVLLVQSLLPSLPQSLLPKTPPETTQEDEKQAQAETEPTPPPPSAPKLEQVSEREWVAVHKDEGKTTIQQVIAPENAKQTGVVSTSVQDQRGATRFVVEPVKLAPIEAAPAPEPSPESTAVAQSAPAPAPPPPPPPKVTPQESAQLTKTDDELSFDQAKAIFEQGNFEKALIAFSKARTRTPAFLPAWFYELLCLKKLGRRQEVARVVDEFTQANPALSQLPVIQNYRSGAAFDEAGK